jgi:hypothetical protein
MKNTGASNIVCFTITGKLYNSNITSTEFVGVLRKLGTGTYTGLNQLVCMHDVSGEYCWMKTTSISSILYFTILVLPVLLDEEYWSFQYCVLTILVLPVLLDEEYWSFQYCVFYNTSITSNKILEMLVVFIQQYW